MKTLDRYVVRNFLLSALLCLVTLMALRIVADLFFNMDEFTKRGRDEEKTFRIVAQDIGTYYGYQSLAYFRELGGVIIVAAAAFSLARMNHTNELTAVLASGVSLRRVLLPVLLCAVGLNVLVIIDAEFLIPRVKHQLIRTRDDVEGTETLRVRLVTDGKNSSWYAPRFFPAEGRLLNPMIILRDDEYAEIGHITGPEAVYDQAGEQWVLSPAGTARPAVMHITGLRKAPTTGFIRTLTGPAQIIDEARKKPANRDVDWSAAKHITRAKAEDLASGLTIEAARLDLDYVSGKLVGMVLHDARFTYRRDGKLLGCFRAAQASYLEEGPSPGWLLRQGQLTYKSDLDPAELALRQSGSGTNYMSTAELTRLLRAGRVSDPAEALLIRHTRFADFINNILMLLVAVPFILSRQRNIKSSAGLTVLMVGALYVFIHLSRYVGLQPALAAWLPILVFGPVAAVNVDAVKT